MNSDIRKIPPWSISPPWIPPDKIPPNLNLTQNLSLTQVGIDQGELTRGDFPDTMNSMSVILNMNCNSIIKCAQTILRAVSNFYS